MPSVAPGKLGVEVVAAVTLNLPHTCLSAPEGPLPSPRNPSRASTSSSSFTIPSSASGMLSKGHFGRRLPAQQLCAAVKPEFERQGGKWTGREVLAAIRKLDAGASASMGFDVLRLLRKPVTLSPAFNSILLQGLAISLRKLGFGVVLHTTNAACVRHQIVDIARK